MTLVMGFDLTTAWFISGTRKSSSNMWLPFHYHVIDLLKKLMYIYNYTHTPLRYLVTVVHMKTCTVFQVFIIFSFSATRVNKLVL